MADRLHCQEMSAFRQTNPDKRYKKGAIFHRPRARPHQAGGRATRVRGPWGTDLIALGAVAIQIPLPTRIINQVSRRQQNHSIPFPPFSFTAQPVSDGWRAVIRGPVPNCVERQSGWESSDNQDENLVSRQWNDGRCSLVWSSTLQNRKQGL